MRSSSQNLTAPDFLKKKDVTTRVTLLKKPSQKFVTLYNDRIMCHPRLIHHQTKSADVKFTNLNQALNQAGSTNQTLDKPKHDRPSES